MGMTFAEKILAKKAGLARTVPDQIVEIGPDTALSHDNAAPIYETFKKIGVPRFAKPEMVAIVLDHATPAPTTKHAENHRLIREMVKEQNVVHFYDVGEGICHQILVEKGLSLPGEVVLGSDSHTPHAGVMGAFGAGIGRSEMASIWATGALWLRVPQSMKITVNGKLPEGVMSKDLALKVIGENRADGADYMSVEWHGEAIEALDLSSRAVLPNLMAEMGAKNSYLPPDQKVLDYLDGRAQRPFIPIYPDKDAVYAIELTYDAANIEPMVAKPHMVDNVAPLSLVAGTHVDQAFIGACTNGRLEDLAAAAGVLKGRKVAAGTRLIVIPASRDVYLKALEAGYIRTFVEAGGMVESPGCGPCMGNHMGAPAVGDVSISTANRNFKGRMGTKESDVYLASPLVVAASAVAGKIIHPSDL
ncbi:MAG: 3-isopropylmalate dehydratase large subunit [Anaerolineales bacterium]|nr:3-isopropylmalate dehydratase large subunit [Anaerolineales bacterium]